MTDATSDLKVICDYLGVKCPELVYSQIANESHKRNPRFLAMVVDGEFKIHVCGAIDNVPHDVRIGLLLHELGHIYGSLDEVDADAWVLCEAPEAGYHYEDQVTFKSPFYQDPVTARNIQCVSSQFMRIIGHMEED